MSNADSRIRGFVKGLESKALSQEQTIKEQAQAIHNLKERVKFKDAVMREQAETIEAIEQRTMVDINIDEMIDLILYADTCAKILKENGFHGKGEALESRYMKFRHLISKDKE